MIQYNNLQSTTKTFSLVSLLDLYECILNFQVLYICDVRLHSFDCLTLIIVTLTYRVCLYSCFNFFNMTETQKMVIQIGILASIKHFFFSQNARAEQYDGCFCLFR